MKLNEVKFLPATNAVADVYTKATGMPIVGEMMAAAAGNGGEHNPFSNVVLNIKEQDGEGNGNYVLTFNSNYDGEISEMSVVLYGANDFELEIVNFSPMESQKYTGTLFFDNDYENIMEFPNGGNYEIQITNTGETFSGKWTFNDATANCESTEFPTVEDIQIEQTEYGWIGRVTFDRDIRTYVGFYFEIYNDTLNIGGFWLQSNIWETTEFEYLGDNTFQVSNIAVDNPQSGEFEDFYVDMRIGKFDECNYQEEGVSGTVTMLETFELTVNLVKEDTYTYSIEVTSNMQAPVENASIYIFDEPSLDGCIGDYTSAFEGHFVPSSEDPTVWYSEDYTYDLSGLEDECGFTYVAQADWIEGSVYVESSEQTYEHAISGTWTYEDQTQNEAL